MTNERRVLRVLRVLTNERGDVDSIDQSEESIKSIDQSEESI